MAQTETEELKELFNNDEIFITHFGRPTTELKIYSNGTGLSFEPSGNGWGRIEPKVWEGRLIHQLIGPEMPHEY